MGSGIVKCSTFTKETDIGWPGIAGEKTLLSELELPKNMSVDGTDLIGISIFDYLSDLIFLPSICPDFV